jgi:hypothetical protein
MRKRQARSILRFRLPGQQVVELPPKDSKFTMTDDVFSVTLEPLAGRVILAVGGQSETGTLSAWRLTFMMVFPTHSGKSSIGGLELDLVPNMARVTVALTDIGHGSMQIHAVENQYS